MRACWGEVEPPPSSTHRPPRQRPPGQQVAEALGWHRPEAVCVVRAPCLLHGLSPAQLVDARWLDARRWVVRHIEQEVVEAVALVAGGWHVGILDALHLADGGVVHELRRGALEQQGRLLLLGLLRLLAPCSAAKGAGRLRGCGAAEE
jgi:hypothetical protein